ALMDQAVLPEQVILELLNRDGAWKVPGQAVDLKGDLLVGRTESVVDRAASAVDVFDLVLMRQELNLFKAEDLREQFHEDIFGSTRDGLSVVDFHGRERIRKAHSAARDPERERRFM